MKIVSNVEGKKLVWDLALDSVTLSHRANQTI